MGKFSQIMKSIRVKLFLTICAVIILIIISLIAVNNVVLEKYYLYNKTKVMKGIYEQINYSYNNYYSYERIENDLKTLAINNNLDILIETEKNVITLTTDKYNIDYTDEIDFFYNIKKYGEFVQKLYEEEYIEINLIKEKDTKINYIIVTAELDNGFELHMKTPTADLKESAKISNQVLIAIGSVIIIISGILASVISNKFAKPILELRDIAQEMSKLNFRKKYNVEKGNEDEINNLGKSINMMSDKLENTIKQLKSSNIELEKDIEQKSKIDEMRKQFISDVSHELKTPIALIQGYAEGLVENVNVDDESREFYANVILDEANKMDRLVRQLLELMKIEYGKLELNNKSFNICSLIDDVIKKCNVMLEENNVKVIFDASNDIMVYADDFYIEQILMNYFTNAIKYSREVNGERIIDVSIDLNAPDNKIRVNVFNSGDKIEEQELQRIWGRFYKIDSSRNRENGGTGIGLAYVRAIMNNYKNDYGVNNKENGVEFYFDLDISN
ncbi:MAG: HAMP domain-containing protein [Clostridiales bacterium]|nr:HAMP domain-containing protein [Clostridiales bacterium]